MKEESDRFIKKWYRSYSMSIGSKFTLVLVPNAIVASFA